MVEKKMAESFTKFLWLGFFICQIASYSSQTKPVCDAKLLLYLRINPSMTIVVGPLFDQSLALELP